MEKSKKIFRRVFLIMALATILISGLLFVPDMYINRRDDIWNIGFDWFIVLFVCTVLVLGEWGLCVSLRYLLCEKKKTVIKVILCCGYLLLLLGALIQCMILAGWI